MATKKMDDKPAANKTTGSRRKATSAREGARTADKGAVSTPPAPSTRKRRPREHWEREAEAVESAAAFDALPVPENGEPPAAASERDNTSENLPVTAPTWDPDDIVVFAMRLTRAERDLIHEAAGSNKASRFVRAVALAAARGDLKTLRAAVQQAKERHEAETEQSRAS